MSWSSVWHAPAGSPRGRAGDRRASHSLWMGGHRPRRTLRQWTCAAAADRPRVVHRHPERAGSEPPADDKRPPSAAPRGTPQIEADERPTVRVGRIQRRRFRGWRARGGSRSGRVVCWRPGPRTSLHNRARRRAVTERSEGKGACDLDGDGERCAILVMGPGNRSRGLRPRTGMRAGEDLTREPGGWRAAAWQR